MLVSRRWLLQEVYCRLTNPQKNDWGKNSGYVNFQGLYNYLKRNDNAVEEKILNGLLKTIGKESYERLLNTKLEDNLITSANVEEKLNEINDKIKNLALNPMLCENLDSLKKTKLTVEAFLKILNNNIENIEISRNINLGNEEAE